MKFFLPGFKRIAPIFLLWICLPAIAFSAAKLPLGLTQDGLKGLPLLTADQVNENPHYLVYEEYKGLVYDLSKAFPLQEEKTSRTQNPRWRKIPSRICNFHEHQLSLVKNRKSPFITGQDVLNHPNRKSINSLKGFLEDGTNVVGILSNEELKKYKDGI